MPYSNSSLNYAIWVSFAEIYNENIYDLFEKMPEVKKGDTKPGRRSPLKLADDRGGSVYIKGLKEVFVTSSDEAYQLLMIGRQNLQFAATRLNHNSSRSHCIFTVKIVRVVGMKKHQMSLYLEVLAVFGTMSHVRPAILAQIPTAFKLIEFRLIHFRLKKASQY